MVGAIIGLDMMRVIAAMFLFGSLTLVYAAVGMGL